MPQWEGYPYACHSVLQSTFVPHSSSIESTYKVITKSSVQTGISTKTSLFAAQLAPVCLQQCTIKVKKVMIVKVVNEMDMYSPSANSGSDQHHNARTSVQ